MGSTSICGWYGFGNAGDEAILSGIVSDLEYFGKDKQSVYVMSAFPRKTKALHGVKVYTDFPRGMRSALRWLLQGCNLRLSCGLPHGTQLFLLGGGGFLSDWQGTAPGYWLGKLRAAKLRGCRTIVYSVGAGPFFTKEGMNLTRDALNSYADAVFCRDKESIRWLEDVGVRPTPRLLYDPAIRKPRSIVQQRVPERIGLVVAPLFTSSLWRNAQVRYERYVNAVVRVAEGLAREFLVELIPMQFSVDYPFMRRIQQLVRRPIVVYSRPLEFYEVQDIIAGLGLVIGMRLHSLIFAFNTGTPFVGITYHQKVDSFLKLVGMDEYSVGIGDGCNWHDIDLDADRVVSLSYRLLTRDKQRVQNLLRHRAEEIWAERLMQLEQVRGLLDKWSSECV